jgi:hypothetical protein
MSEWTWGKQIEPNDHLRLDEREILATTPLQRKRKRTRRGFISDRSSHRPTRRDDESHLGFDVDVLSWDNVDEEVELFTHGQPPRDIAALSGRYVPDHKRKPLPQYSRCG